MLSPLVYAHSKNFNAAAACCGLSCFACIMMNVAPVIGHESLPG